MFPAPAGTTGSGNGTDSDNEAAFDWFEYTGE